MYKIVLKRVYDPKDPGDGYRVLVDRLWPRGITKETAALDDWLRDITPSTELRRSYSHRPEGFASFRAAYLRELDANPAAAGFAGVCRDELAHSNVTLLYAAVDGAHSNAAVLLEWLEQKTEGEDRS